MKIRGKPKLAVPPDEPPAVAVRSTPDERIYCENVVGELADEQGLVVITPAVVEMVVAQRASARRDLVARFQKAIQVVLMSLRRLGDDTEEGGPGPIVLARDLLTELLETIGKPAPVVSHLEARIRELEGDRDRWKARALKAAERLGAKTQ